jgi:hypothetical protein
MAGRRRRPDTTWLITQQTKNLRLQLSRIERLLDVVRSDASEVANLKSELDDAVGKALKIAAQVDGHMLRHAGFNARRNFLGSHAALHTLRERAAAVVPPLGKTLADLISEAGNAAELAGAKASLQHDPSYHQTPDQVLQGGGPQSVLAVLAILALWLRRRE